MIHHGDLFDVLPTLDADSIDAGVTDPPYGIGFMGREWDTFKPENVRTAAEMKQRKSPEDLANLKNVYGRKRSPAQSPSQVEYNYSIEGLRGFQAWTEKWAREVFRVLKPGGYIVVCGAPRSYHRMACGLEDAGFVIRDKFSWLFASGFPKSLNFGCKCRGNTLPYSHAGLSTPERDVRRVPDADVSSAVDARQESREVLLDGLSEQDVPAHGETDGSRVDEGREQSVLEGRELHRAGEGLSDDPHATTSQGARERLRPGAHRSGGADPGSSTEGERRSAPPRSGSGKQRTRKSASLRLPSRTLDDGASGRGARCERCGGLTSARGLGTALKPAHEPIALAWKPFKGSIADTYARYGTGALNIDACRIDGPPSIGGIKGSDTALGLMNDDGWQGRERVIDRSMADGRWPANVLLDEEAAGLLDEMSGELVSGFMPAGTEREGLGYHGAFGDTVSHDTIGDRGGASRFFYVAKPSRSERDVGCYDLPERPRDESRKAGNPGGDNPRNRGLQPRGNIHPTVKPVELMRWLVRLVTPPGGTVLDPFTGSGTTGMACAYEQRPFIGIEREAEYVEIARRRIASVAPLFTEAVS